MQVAEQERAGDRFGQRQLLLGRAPDDADQLLDDERGAEREQQAVERVLAVGAAHAELEQHAEDADEHRREQQRDRVARAERQRQVRGLRSGNQPSFGATRKSATYMPSANSEPCARLIVSITPTISMKPSAISANSSPSEMPLTRCGRRLASAAHRRAFCESRDAGIAARSPQRPHASTARRSASPRTSRACRLRRVRVLDVLRRQPARGS